MTAKAAVFTNSEVLVFIKKNSAYLPNHVYLRVVYLSHACLGRDAVTLTFQITTESG